MTIIDELQKLTAYNADNILKYMVRVIMSSTRFIGAENNKVVYKELPNLWETRNYTLTDRLKTQCDPFYELISVNNNFTKDEEEKRCSGYDECNIKYNIIEPKEDIRLLWEFDNESYERVIKYLDQYYEDEDNENYMKFKSNAVTNYLKKFDNIDTNKLFFNGILKINNTSGFNDDHRGSDHCELKLPFVDNIVLEDPTLYDFVSALYKLKSHKFDKWYELYTNCKVTEIDNGYRIDLEFDHGS